MSSTATVLGTAIFADDRNTWKRELEASCTVEYAVGTLQMDLCKHVSKVYGLVPPLDPLDMQIKYFPGAEPLDPLSICSSTGLTTLTFPKAESARRIQTHLANRAQANQTSVEHNTTLATDSDSATTSQSSTAAAPSRKSKNRKKRNTASKANPSSTDNPPLTANSPQVTMDSQLKEMLASMRNEMAEFRRENGSMRNEIESMCNKNESMRNEIESMRNKNERILTENARILGENARILGENERILGENGSMREENERILNENGSIRDDLERLRKELEAEKHERAQDITALREITALLVPLRLRVLLDLARKKVLEDLGHETWEELRASRSIHQLAEDISNDLKRKNLSFLPSPHSIFFLCAYNNIRRAGNVAAHSAEQCDIKSAVESQPLDSSDRRCLENLFRYAYNGALI